MSKTKSLEPVFKWTMKEPPTPEVLSMKDFRKTIKLVGRRALEPDLITIFINNDVFLRAAESATPDDECGLGFFFGTPFYDEEEMGYCVNIKDIRLLSATEFDRGCVAGLESLYKMATHADTNPIDGTLVGMVRSVPGAGVKLKQAGLEYFQLWMPYPYQVLMLVDPMEDELGFVSVTSGDPLSGIHIYSE